MTATQYVSRTCGSLLIGLFAFSAGNAIAAPVPQTGQWQAQPTAQVQAIEERFTSGDAQLRGTLYLPKVRGKVPAVVAFHGASEPTRDLALYEHLKRMLPPLGIAVLVYDRRASGQSSGKPAEGDFVQLADDGIAAQRMLARDPRIDASRIGFWGLSQGGWLSLLAASRSPEAAFAISVSAPMTTPDVQMRFAVANVLKIRGHPQSDIDLAVAARKAVDDFERGQLDRKTAQGRLDAAAAQPWFDEIYMGKTFHDPAESGWAKEIRNDPMIAVEKIRVPTLIVYGSRDPWVPVSVSMAILQSKADQLAKVTTAVIAGANHEMNLHISDAAEVDPQQLAGHAPDSAEYFGLLASWLTAHGFTDRLSSKGL